jgi:flagellar M-ring protein FliF
MNEWFKKFFKTIKEKWAKWTKVQKGILIGIFVVVIVAIVLLITLSSRQTSVRLFNSPVTDQTKQGQILDYLSEHHVNAYATSDGYIYVDDAKTAEKYQSMLVADQLVPTEINPYDLWKTDRFSISDFQENKVNWKQTIERQLKQRLEALPDIRLANVTVALPEDSLFASTQKMTTASVTLFAAYGREDVLSSKKKVQGLQNLIKKSVEGLTDEGITILNGDTLEEINDFAGMEESEAVEITEKQQKLIRKKETEYSNQVLEQLAGTFGRDRVRITSMKIEMDQSKQTVQEKKYSGVTLKEDNPDTPYDDSEIRDNLVLSFEEINNVFEGTGYNPEGPAGVQGQNPAVYSDASNLIGRETRSSIKQNNALNEQNIYKEVAPQIDRVTLAVNIDGTWKRKYDEEGHLLFTMENGIQREYTPISKEDLDSALELVRAAVGYDKSRGDSVVVTNIAFDRSEQFAAEDEAERKKIATRRTIFFVSIGLILVLIAFILIRLISREIERRRRLREEELLRKQQAEREAALWEAKEKGMEVTMSVEERKRAELQENAIAMAKEHPEDVAMLIRTWLTEE